MGVALYVSGYKKNKEFITGEIKILEWYEVNTDILGEDNEIENSSITLHNVLESISIAAENFSMFGLSSPGELSFYDNVMNNISGSGYRNENGNTYCIMFDGGRILNVVEQILCNLNKFNLEPYKMKREKENLEKLQKVLSSLSS